MSWWIVIPRKASLTNWIIPWSKGLGKLTGFQIVSIVWKTKVHYRILRSPPPVSVLSWINPVHASHPTSWRSISILFFHPRLGLPSGSFPKASTPNLYALFFSRPCYMLCLFYPFLFDHSNYIWCGVQIIKLIAHRYVACYTPLLPRPTYDQISSSEPYSRTLSPYFFPFIVSDQV